MSVGKLNFVYHRCQPSPPTVQAWSYRRPCASPEWWLGSRSSCVAISSCCRMKSVDGLHAHVTQNLVIWLWHNLIMAKLLQKYLNIVFLSIQSSRSFSIYFIIVIVIKKGQQCKAGREWYTPYQSEDPSPTIPTYRQKEEKGKESRRL